MLIRFDLLKDISADAEVNGILKKFQEPSTIRGHYYTDCVLLLRYDNKSTKNTKLTDNSNINFFTALITSMISMLKKLDVLPCMEHLILFTFIK